MMHVLSYNVNALQMWLQVLLGQCFSYFSQACEQSPCLHINVYGNAACFAAGLHGIPAKQQSSDSVLIS